MTGPPCRVKGAVAGAVVVASLASAIYLLAPERAPKRPGPVDNRASAATPRTAMNAKKIEPVGQGKSQSSNFKYAGGKEVFIKTPPQSKVISSVFRGKGRVSEFVLKLESLLTPTELQVYYTDLLVKDWMISRDDLTEGVGWSGVFMQIEPDEKTIGVFAVVKKIGQPSGPSNPTAISIIKAEER